MTDLHSRSINVVMPVFRGGIYWDATLESLRESRTLFNDVVLSFDGPTRGQLARALESGEHSDISSHVLVAPTVMTGPEHMLWFINQFPISVWDDSQLVMILAEDDLICAQSLSEGLKAVKGIRNSILFGSWRNFVSHAHREEERSCDTVPSFTVYPENEIAMHLTSIVKQLEVTTISGITLEMRALRSYLKLVAGRKGGSPLLNGVRAEFFLATQPSVKHLVRCSEPITAIQIHPDQEGTIVDPWLKSQDEALYQLWLCVTHQTVPMTARMVAALRFAKGLFTYPKTLRLLPNAWRTFRGQRNVA